MQTMGLIGGMSWESTLEYYRLINREVKARLGGLHSARCVLYSVDFEEIERCQREGDWDRAADILTRAAQSLEKAGADFFLLCTNTMHVVAGQIEAGVSIPLLHIADATADRVIENRISTVGLLGTRYTMEMDFYRSRVEERGVRVIIPGEEDRGNVNRVIFEELCLGRVSDSSRKLFAAIITKMARRGAEGIILGCTEIGLLVKGEGTGIPLFDTTRIHALEAVNRALAES